MKYKLTNNEKTIYGVKVYQIEALKDFGIVKKGDLGGWVESENNLSQTGSCWVGDSAVVFENAVVHENAMIYGNAEVYGDVRVHGNAKVFGSARIGGDASVYEYAIVFGRALVYGSARIGGDASVYGNAVACGNAKVSENQYIFEGHCITDLSKNIKESIRCQTGLGVFNDEVIVYKQVTKKLKSFHDNKFEYKVGEIVEAENPELSSRSCASGLHGSNMNYWNKHEFVEFSTFLAIKVQLKDVITVQEGKIRFKKGLVLGTYDVELDQENKKEHE